MLRLEQKLSETCKDKNSILKAIAAGEWMLKEIENIRLILERAEDASMKESAMGTFMEVEKYQQLGNAQERISVLQKRKFCNHGIRRICCQTEISLKVK